MIFVRNDILDRYFHLALHIIFKKGKKPTTVCRDITAKQQMNQIHLK